MDGDSHQGVQLLSEDIPSVILTLSAINRWIENATTDYSMDGIDKSWRDCNDDPEGASSTAYMLFARINLLEEELTLSPFLGHQSGVLSTYGASLEFSQAINDKLSVGLDGTYAFYEEDTDDSSDEDASSYLAHATVFYANFWIGSGYYVMSDDNRVGATAVGNNSFDPMEEGVYGAEPGDTTFYLDAGYSQGPFELAVVLGNTEIDSSIAGDEGCTELDVYLTYKFSETAQVELMFVNIDDDNSARDYQVYAGGLKMTF
jgi:hypothetical protein